jgi:hypothetical protein
MSYTQMEPLGRTHGRMLTRTATGDALPVSRQRPLPSATDAVGSSTGAMGEAALLVLVGGVILAVTGATARTWADFFRYVHLLAMACGVAGSTIANLMLTFDREPWLAFAGLRPGPWLPPSALPRLTRLMGPSVLVLAASGAAMGYLRGGGTLDVKLLTIKLLVVAFIFLNGMHLTLRLEPALAKAQDANPHADNDPVLLRLVGRLRWHCLVSLAGWYTITALSLYVVRR